MAFFKKIPSLKLKSLQYFIESLYGSFSIPVRFFCFAVIITIYLFPQFLKHPRRSRIKIDQYIINHRMVDVIKMKDYKIYIAEENSIYFGQ